LIHVKNLLVIIIADLASFTNANTSTLVTYKFVNDTANFVFDEGGPFPATATITGKFILDTATQTIVSADIKLSGLPSFLSDWNSSYKTVGDSFWTVTPPRFIVTNGSGDQLGLQFSHANTAYSFTLYIAELADTQQWGPVYDVSVTGGVDQTGKGQHQSSQSPLTSDPPTINAASTITDPSGWPHVPGTLATFQGGGPHDLGTLVTFQGGGPHTISLLAQYAANFGTSSNGVAPLTFAQTLTQEIHNLAIPHYSYS
jgi:hypothetical protein